MKIAGYSPLHSSTNTKLNQPRQVQTSMQTQPLKAAKVTFSGGGREEEGVEDFDVESAMDWLNLCGDIFDDSVERDNFLGKLTRYGKVSMQLSSAIPSIISMALQGEFPESSPLADANPLFGIYELGTFLDSYQWGPSNPKAVYFLMLDLVEGMGNAFEQNDKKSIKSFNKTIPPKIKKDILEVIQQSDVVSDKEKERWMKQIERWGDQFAARALPTLITSGLMFDSSERVRERAYERFCELDNKRDRRGNPYIDPLITTGLYAGLTLSEPPLPSEDPESKISLPQEHEFRGILTTFNRYVLSSITTHINNNSASIWLIEQMLDEAGLEKKKKILQDLREQNIFARITNPEVKQICERMYDNGYDLKNGKLLPAAYLSHSQEQETKAEEPSTSSGFNGKVQSTENRNNTVPGEFRKELHGSILQNKPHGKLFLVKDAGNLGALSRYAEKLLSDFARDSGSKALVKTVKSKEDIDNLFRELKQVSQGNPKVFVTIDPSTDPKIRQRYWNQLHLKMEKPSATVLTLFSPTQAKEYAPYTALQNRISSMQL